MLDGSTRAEGQKAGRSGTAAALPSGARLRQGPADGALRQRLAILIPLLAMSGWLVLQHPAFLIAAFALPALLAVRLDPGVSAHRILRDSLTGLHSRDTLLEALQHRLERRLRHGGDVAVLLFEIDRFRAMEHGLDRARLEEVLVHTARRLTEGVRDSDVCARLDGPTFALLVSGHRSYGTDEMAGLCRRLQDQLSRPVADSVTPLHPTVSVGYAVASHGAGPLPAELLHRATVALLEGQRSGCRGLQGFDAALQTRIETRAQLAARAAAALEAGEFVPFFQPQICLATGEVTGLEALARWRCPERGLISPGDFLPVLQETGLMPELGQRMLTAALEHLADWDAAGKDLPQIAVNFSTQELEQPDLVDRVAFTLDRFGLAPGRLSIEILESVVATAPGGAVAETLQGLSRLGCRLDLDDFGTGHASITTIRQLPVDRLKIDRSFITGLDRDPEQQRLVAAILTMADRLGLSVLAEGVETLTEWRLLREMGCDYAQGFGIGRPMPGAEVAGWLSAFSAGDGEGGRAEAS